MFSRKDILQRTAGGVVEKIHLENSITISAMVAEFKNTISLLRTIPGVDRNSAITTFSRLETIYSSRTHRFFLPSNPHKRCLGYSPANNEHKEHRLVHGSVLSLQKHYVYFVSLPHKLGKNGNPLAFHNRKPSRSDRLREVWFHYTIKHGINQQFCYKNEFITNR